MIYPMRGAIIFHVPDDEVPLEETKHLKSSPVSSLGICMLEKACSIHVHDIFRHDTNSDRCRVVSVNLFSHKYMDHPRT